MDTKGYKLYIRAGQLNKTLAPLLKTNKYVREYFLETLAICGILETPDYKGFFKQYIPFWVQQQRPHKFVECDPPLAFWKGQDGINQAALKFFFPQEDIHLENS